MSSVRLTFQCLCFLQVILIDMETKKPMRGSVTSSFLPPPAGDHELKGLEDSNVLHSSAVASRSFVPDPAASAENRTASSQDSPLAESPAREDTESGASNKPSNEVVSEDELQGKPSEGQETSLSKSGLGKALHREREETSNSASGETSNEEEDGASDREGTSISGTSEAPSTEGCQAEAGTLTRRSWRSRVLIGPEGGSGARTRSMARLQGRKDMEEGKMIEREGHESETSRSSGKVSFQAGKASLDYLKKASKIKGSSSRGRLTSTHLRFKVRVIPHFDFSVPFFFSALKPRFSRV
jgi:hypothetical protein